MLANQQTLAAGNVRSFLAIHGTALVLFGSNNFTRAKTTLARSNLWLAVCNSCSNDSCHKCVKHRESCEPLTCDRTDVECGGDTTIGIGGGWLIASMLLLVAAGCLIKLQQIAKQEAIENLPKIWIRAKYKWMALARIIKIRKMINLCTKEIDAEEGSAAEAGSKKTN